MCVARRIPQKDQPDHPFGGSFSIAFQIALCNHQAETMATASTLHFRRHITLSGSLAILFLLVLALPVALQAQRAGVAPAILLLRSMQELYLRLSRFSLRFVSR